MPSRREIIGWAALAAFVTVPAWIGDLESSPARVRLFQAAYLIGFVGYGLLIWPLIRPGGTALEQWHTDPSWGWIIPAVVMRLVLWGTAPSDDVYRYLWEGRVQRSGFNPYVHAPTSPELSELRDARWQRVNHPDYAAIYGPLAQLEFRVLAGLRPTAQAFKLAHGAVDCGTVVLLALWCRSAGRGPGFAKLYALCPLVLTAFGVGGHVDSLMLALITGAGVLMSRAGWHCSRAVAPWPAVLLGAAAGVKVVAVVLWPWLLMKDFRAGLAAFVTLLLLYVPFYDAGPALFDSLVRFTAQTTFFGLVHTPLSWMLGAVASRWLCLAAFIAVVGLTLRRRFAFASYAYVVFAALFLLMPVAHYWYLPWIILFIPFQPRAAWLALATSMVFYFEASHARAATGEWAMPAWAFAAVYAPFLLVWAATSWHRRSEARRR